MKLFSPGLFSKMNFPAFALLCTALLLLMASCGKDPDKTTDNSQLQHKWTINSRVAVFPGNTSLNFTETSSPNDYLDFRTNDSVYSYITSYLPFSKDTASYTVSSNTIAVHDTRQYGIVFQHQDNNGVVQTSTDIELVSVTDNALVLKFPTQGTVNSGGITTYYPGTITYNLSR